MERASRWLKGFFGMKKDSQTVAGESLASSGSLKREKVRRSFSGVKLSREFDSSAAAAKAPARVSASDAFWGLDADEEKQQSKHDMAVVAATAAVAAAQAAVAAVKRNGKRRGAGGKEPRAAEKIQSDFRAFLARKALRALKGVVKIQALVRGYLIRKQAATALHRMQTLIRAQETIRFERARRFFDKENSNSLETQVDKSSHETFDEVSDGLKHCPKVNMVKRQSRSYRRINGPNSQGLRPDWCFSSNDEFRFKTDESTPKLQKTSKKVLRSFGDGPPSYMASTKSFKAKLSRQSVSGRRNGFL